MNQNQVDDRTIVLGGALLSLDEAAEFAGVAPEILLNNPMKSLHAIYIGQRVSFFENDITLFKRFLENANRF
jgi:hypothetical protein